MGLVRATTRYVDPNASDLFSTVLDDTHRRRLSTHQGTTSAPALHDSANYCAAPVAAPMAPGKRVRSRLSSKGEAADPEAAQVCGGRVRKRLDRLNAVR